MTAYKILLILAIIAFTLGALLPVFVEGGTPRSMNWLCLGMAFGTAAFLIKYPG